MDTQFFYDANKVKWMVEEVTTDKRGYLDNYIWIHVEGSNEQYSGFVGETIEQAFEEFLEGGYLYEEGREHEKSAIIYLEE